MNKFLIGMAMLIFGLVSCKKDHKDPSGEQSGTTYMAMSVNLGESLRASEDDKYNKLGEWEGNDEIKDVTVFLIQGGTVEHKDFTYAASGTAEGTFSVADAKVTTVPWKTTPGAKIVYVVVNGKATTQTEAILANLKTKSTKEAFEAAYKEAKEITAQETTSGTGGAKKDLIMMTGTPVAQTIADGVTAAAAPTSATNNVKISVRRTMARVTVTRDSGLGAQDAAIEIKNNNKVIGTLKNITWSVGQTAKLTKILWQDVDGGFDFNALKVKSEDAAYAFVPSETVSFKNQAPTHYDYSKLKEKNALSVFTRAGATVQSVVSGTMKFITESTHATPTNIADGLTGGYRKGNTTYVQVIGTFEPAADLWAEGEQAGYHAGQPIYLGVITGKWYTDKTKAKEANKLSVADSEKDGVIEFKTGTMYYYAWLNPNETTSTKWTLSPVVRNNIYHVNVKSFSKYGFSGNPYNPTPEDPDNPGPDPDDPTPDPKDPLEDKETYMTTEITVIKWGVRSYDVAF